MSFASRPIKRRSPILRVVAKLVVPIVLALVTIEAILWVAPGLQKYYRQAIQPRSDSFWEARFLQTQELGEPFAFGSLHQEHPTRGWTTRPNTRVTYAGVTYTSNNRGHRALDDYQPDSRRYGVLVVGDSFTFGMDADDWSNWPAMLQALDPEVQVLNLGVGGYGIDQMYLTVRETIAGYRPRLVIAAFVGDDLDRTMLSFRDYQKPKFILQGDQLMLTNTPIGNVAETYRRLKQKYQLAATRSRLTPRSLEAFRVVLPQLMARLAESSLRLNTRLVEEMAGTSAAHGAEFLLVHLAWGRRIRDPALRDAGEDFVNRLAPTDIPALNTRPYFLRESGMVWTLGHYQGPEARLVSRLVLERLRQLPSWRRFVTEKPHATAVAGEEPGPQVKAPR